MGFRALAPSHLPSHSRLHAFMLRDPYVGFFCAAYFLLWCILFVFANSSYRMSVPYCLLWCIQVITTRREKNSRRRSMTRQDPAWESTGGVNAHGLSNSYPVLNMLWNAQCMLTHDANVEASRYCCNYSQRRVGRRCGSSHRGHATTTHASHVFA